MDIKLKHEEVSAQLSKGFNISRKLNWEKKMTSVARKKKSFVSTHTHTYTYTHTRMILFISVQNGTIQKNKVLLSVKTFVTLCATTRLRPTHNVLELIIWFFGIKYFLKPK